VSATERAIRWSTIAAVAAVAAVAGWVSYEHALAVVRAHGESGAVAQVYPVTVDGLIYSASMVLLDAARRRASAPVLARWLLAAGISATLAANVAAGLHFGPVGAVVAAWPALALVGSYELLMLIIRSGARQLPGLHQPVTQSTPEIGHAVADFKEAKLSQNLGQFAAGRPAEMPPGGDGNHLRPPKMMSAVPEIRLAETDLPGAPEVSPDPVTLRAQLNGHAAKAEKLYAADITAGRVPGIRRIMTGLKVGDAKARLVQEHLRQLTQ